MTTDTTPAHCTKLLWTGRVISTLLILFLTFDGVMKLVQPQPVLDACDQLGIPRHAVAGIGVVLLACTALYAIPATSVLGAVLLTGYLGGAVFCHVRVAGPIFPIVFSSSFGLLVWAGLYLREPRLRALLPLRATAACARHRAAAPAAEPAAEPALA
jgi:hypothetical protein